MLPPGHRRILRSLQDSEFKDSASALAQACLAAAPLGGLQTAGDVGVDDAVAAQLSLGGAELPPNVTRVSMTGPCRERHQRRVVTGSLGAGVTTVAQDPCQHRIDGKGGQAAGDSTWAHATAICWNAADQFAMQQQCFGHRPDQAGACAPGWAAATAYSAAPMCSLSPSPLCT